MNAIDLKEAIEKGEDYYTEFKEEAVHSDDLAAEIVAFANSDGGKLLIGVSDARRPVGVTDADRVLQRVDNICAQNSEPPIRCKIEKIKIDDTLILSVVVPKGPERPYRTNKGVYHVRTNSGKRQATREELLRLYQSTRSLYYDELPVPETGLAELDIAYFEKFFEEFHSRKIVDIGLSLHDLLKSMKLFTQTDDQKAVFSLAGLLLFGKNPQQHIPYAKITVAKFTGNEIGDIFEKKDIEGKLIDQITNIESLIKLYTQSHVIIKGFEKENRYELPLEAIRELIVNAVVHRDYHIRSQIRVFIFDNRIEIMSPGTLPNSITLENIRWGGIHVERNPIIVSFLAKMGYMTQIGTGIIRAIRLLKEHTGKEPDFEERGNDFVARIWRNQKIK